MLLLCLLFSLGAMADRRPRYRRGGPQRFLRSLNALPRKHRYGEETPEYSYETFLVDQVTDHFAFGPVDPPTFKQRVFVNATFWKNRDSPILFYTGNEGALESFAQNTGFMWELAPRLGAMVVFAEHRYYGPSTPFPGENLFAPPVDNRKLSYLSTEQALRDFVHNIDWLRKKYDVSSKAAVIAIGGSYGGMLSAYLRLKYPWSVNGALAASAPILQFPGLMPDNNIGAFFEIITRDYKAYPGCAESIRLAWDVIDRLEGQNLAQFRSVFNLCDDLTSYDDVDALKEWLQEAYIYLAMTDYQYPTSFLRPLPGEPVEAACKFFNRPSEIPEDPYVLLRQVVASVGVFYNYTGTCNCQCYKLFDDSSIDVGQDGWNYQSCTEYMLPMAANGKTDMFFPQPWDDNLFAAQCMQMFNVTPNKYWAAREMGGRNFQLASNVIFSNGGRDPWSGGGITEDLNPSVQALFIPEGAHHLDLRASNPLDPISVRRARAREEEIMRQWIEEAKHGLPPFGPHPPPGISPPVAFGIGTVFGVVCSAMAVAAGLFYLGILRVQSISMGGPINNRVPGQSATVSGLLQPLLGGGTAGAPPQGPGTSSSAPQPSQGAAAHGGDAA